MGADFLCTSMPYAKITLEREQELKDIVDALNDDDDNSDVAFLRETTLGVGDDEPLDDIKKRLHEAVRIMEWDDPVGISSYCYLWLGWGWIMKLF